MPTLAPVVPSGAISALVAPPRRRRQGLQIGTAGIVVFYSPTAPVDPNSAGLTLPFWQRLLRAHPAQLQRRGHATDSPVRPCPVFPFGLSGRTARATGRTACRGGDRARPVRHRARACKRRARPLPLAGLGARGGPPLPNGRQPPPRVGHAGRAPRTGRASRRRAASHLRLAPRCREIAAADFSPRARGDRGLRGGRQRFRRLPPTAAGVRSAEADARFALDRSRYSGSGE